MKNLRAGFTLVELVVVIAVLAILAGIALPRFVNSMEIARGSKIIADMHACESAVNIYYAKKGVFPADSDALVSAYLAKWPKAPQGKAIIKKHDASDLEFTVNTDVYQYVIQNEGTELTNRIGRVKLGGYTIEDLLDYPGGSLILENTTEENGS